MKVLQINATYGYSSTGLIVKDIGDMLEYNNDTAYFAYQSANHNPKNGYVVGNKIDWKLHAVLCRIFGKQTYYSKIPTKQLIGFIEKIKPDIVHLHNLHSNFVHVNRLLRYLGQRDIATVITMHDCWYFTGKCFHYVDVGCNRFITGCGNCPKKKAPPSSLIFDASKKVLKDKARLLSSIKRLKIVGCSKWVCDEAKKSLINGLDIEHVYNGVDTEVFKPKDCTSLVEKYNLQDCYVIMGMANKWLLNSNKQALIETIKVLNNKCKLVIVGCESEQIERLKQLSPNIIAVGFIKDRQELAKYYNLANVFVNVTHADTLPTVNMESICCGTPVITYDCCGSPELIIDGCGKVVKENDIKQLISSIISNMKKIEEGALNNARRVFDKNTCYKKYLEIYKNLKG